MYSTSNEMADSLQNINTTSGVFSMATVTQISGNDVYLTFYGEESQREKSYKRLASYSPNIGDEVIVAKLNKSYTIMGKVV